MIFYKPIKIIIDASDLVKVILDVVIQHHSLSNSIMSDWGLVFTLKFWSLFCYFLEIKQIHFIAFQLQTDS